MKHLTNILLVVALICYAFLPFYDLSLQGSMTGFEFTAAKITHANGFGDVLFGLIPFLTCFAAIAFNCLRSKYWVLAAIVCIAVCLNFYVGPRWRAKPAKASASREWQSAINWASG